MEEIKATKEEVRKALKLWYEEYGEMAEDFGTVDEDYSNATDIFIEYLDRVQGKVPV